MRIAIDCRMIGSSGIGVVLRELLPLLLKSSHRFLLLGDPENLGSYLDLGAEVRTFRQPIYSVSEQMRFPRKTLRGVDVLLYPHYNVPILPSVPTVAVIHDLAPLALPRFFAGPAKRLYAHLFFRLAVWSSTIVIAVSHFTKREMVRRLGADPSRIRVVHNGPGRTFPGGAEPHAEFLRSAGIYTPYLLAVGNLKPHKNLKRLVESFTVLKRRGYGDLSLVIAGRPYMDSGEFAGLPGYGREELLEVGVVLPGFVPDEHMPTLYGNADLVVLPSLYEGFGLTALEALRYGSLPLVADVASLPEVIDDPELRFHPADVAAMAERMALFLNNPELRAEKIAAQRRGMDRFSWNTAARCYLDAIHEAGLGGRRNERMPQGAA